MSNAFKHEILTQPITVLQMHAELEHFISYWTILEFEHCQVLFGYPWGIEYYPGKTWTPEKIKLDHVVSKIKELEFSKIGQLGQDDVFIDIGNLQVQFCHDSDIHIHFECPSEHSEYFYNRWKEIGFKPSEWRKDEKNKPGTRLRFEDDQEA